MNLEPAVSQPACWSVAIRVLMDEPPGDTLGVGEGQDFLEPAPQWVLFTEDLVVCLIPSPLLMSSRFQGTWK